MTLRRPIRLLAVEESGQAAIEGDIERMQIGNIIRIEVAEVGVELGGWRLGAWLGETRLGERVVLGAEVEVQARAAAALDVGRVEDEGFAIVEADGD